MMMRKTKPRARAAMLAAAFMAALTALTPTAPGARAEDGATADAPRLGPETNLPIPRFVSLKAKANIRRGPGLTHRIDWVFMRKGMPLEVIAEHGHWRRVRDVDDDSGWVHHALLSGARSAVVIAESAALRLSPAADASMVAVAEAGAILKVEQCEPDWCEVQGDGRSGWTLKAELWGARPDEAFD